MQKVCQKNSNAKIMPICKKHWKNAFFCKGPWGGVAT